MNIKKTIAKWLKITEDDIQENDYAKFKKFGESRSVEYEYECLTKTFCKVTQWANGEGHDISWETETNVKTGVWTNKRIELHDDELQTMLYCLKDLGYFE
jgi:hypothetical protein